MLRWLFREKNTEIIDGLVVIMLGVGLLAGKIVGVVLNPMNVAVGVCTTVAGIGLIYGNLTDASRGNRIVWGSWWLLAAAVMTSLAVNLL